jgi:hypothetical protein
MSELLISEVIPAPTIQDEVIQEMFSLFSSYYREIQLSSFSKDILSKDWVMLFKDVQNLQIQGFTSLRIIEHCYLSQKMTVIYSGDTVIHQPYRNSRIFAKSWIKTVWNLARNKPQPCYWLLLTSGYKTYRFLPVYLKCFFPCYNQPTPPDTLHLMNNIADHLFGNQFTSATGIVCLHEGATPLKNSPGQTSKMRAQDPHIQFFETKNPGHVNGDELVCLADLSDDNLTAIGKRMKQ